MTSDLDRTDLAILRELQGSGRLTIQELSDRVRLSPSPCARRVRLLEEAGYITGYAAVIDEARLGFGISVFVSVKLAQQVDDNLRQFEEAVRTYPEVVECWLMTGSRDYLMRIVVADLAEFERFLTTRLTRIPCVASIESSIPIRKVKAGLARLP